MLNSIAHAHRERPTLCKKAEREKENQRDTWCKSAMLLLDVWLDDCVQVSPQLLLWRRGVVLNHLLEGSQQGDTASIGPTHQLLRILHTQLEDTRRGVVAITGRRTGGGGRKMRWKCVCRVGTGTTHSFKRLVILAFLSCCGRCEKCWTCFKAGTGTFWKPMLS